ncbi:hypothetical protein BpHYR1_020829 [Brachionus plicatilis]|uniref:Uncharacterized protein n=1 Tax=Brachionus plicatilis TaxID=10195 RepID=A0A3M7R0V8_BRAPC|nr:hypothetical protein BpHYR1_020829 [Brachionus plicatilis]
MKKALIVHLILSLALGLRCSTIAVLDLSAVTPYTIINQTNMTAYDNETVSDTDSQDLEPVIPSYFNDAQMEQNVSEILPELANSTNQTSAVISNYVEVFVFNEGLAGNTTRKFVPETTRSQIFLVTPDGNSTNDSFAAFNISIYENTFNFSASSTIQCQWLQISALLMVSIVYVMESILA